MASVLELANLAAMAYDSSKNVFQGWHLNQPYGDKTGRGYYAESYLNSAKKEIVFAIRGTDLEDCDWLDFLADAQIGLWSVPYQLEQAKPDFEEEKKFAEGIGYKIFLTGHSLGDALASLLAAQEPTKPPVVTFNSPGAMFSNAADNAVFAVGLYNSIYYSDISKFLHIRANADIISRLTGPHMGKVASVYVDAWGDGKTLGFSRHAAHHKMANMVKAIERLPWYHKDLEYDDTKIVTPKMMSK